MKEYIVSIPVQAKPAASRAEMLKNLKADFHAAATKVRPDIEAIVKKSGGQIINGDLEIYIAGSMMLVKVSVEAAAEIRALKGVSSVNENRIVHINHVIDKPRI